jgi:transposase
MPQSRALSLRLDVHQESIAVAKAHHAEAVYLGSIATRPCDLDTLLRNQQSRSQSRIFVDEAGPCGYGLSRDLRTKGHACWGVAPSLIPQKASARVDTERRDAVHEPA